MSDHVPNNMQEMPWEYDLNCDLDQWIDWSLHDSIPEDSNWAMAPVDQDAGMPDASGSLDEGPIRRPSTPSVQTRSFSCLMGTPLADVPSAHQDVQVDVDVPAQLLPDVERAPNTCTIRGCKHKGTFKSAYELKRHFRTVHSDDSVRPFTCGAQGCFKGTSPSSFVRPDKLTAHIKAVHKPSTLFEKCPVTDCDYGPCNLETLGVHIQRRHDGDEQGSAVLNATPCKVVKCPLWRCGKYMPAKKLLQHVGDHPIDEITANMPELESQGLRVEADPSWDFVVQIVCPVCETTTDCIEQFKTHHAAYHLWKIHENATEHFEKWQACLLRSCKKLGRARVNGLTPWSCLKVSYSSFKSKFRVLSCPTCKLAVDLLVSGWERWRQAEALISTHHLGLLRPDAEVVAELFPHRMQILRFWPEFVTHPVFADFDQLQESADDSASVQPAVTEGQTDDDLDMLY